MRIQKTLITHITKCRSCEEGNLIDLLSLGNQYLSDFRRDNTCPPQFPLDLVLCQTCFLVQLKETTPPSLMYGDQYGFKSGINGTIRKDLADVVAKAQEKLSLKHGDIVMDIGANDGTLLSNYTNRARLHVLAVDPVKKFKPESQQYADVVIDDYFSAQVVSPYLNNRRVSIITAISMFYDLDNPNMFVEDITRVLDSEGIWVIQQNYLPAMLQQNAYDNIVHEHVEYYSLLSLQHLLKRHGLEIFDVEQSGINGGSFRTYICLAGKRPISYAVKKLEEKEKRLRLDTIYPYISFARRIKRISRELTHLITNLAIDNKKVYAYGASTRGNTLLQYSHLDNMLIAAAVERNPEKWGKKISSLQIPIISEEQARKEHPAYMLVLPWFFKAEFIEREEEYLASGGRFIFPLPEVEVIHANQSRI